MQALSEARLGAARVLLRPPARRGDLAREKWNLILTVDHQAGLRPGPTRSLSRDGVEEERLLARDAAHEGDHDQPVVSGAAVRLNVARGREEEEIGAAPAAQNVLPQLIEEHVRAGAALERVRLAAPVQKVLAASSEERVGPGPAKSKSLPAPPSTTAGKAVNGEL